MVALESLYVTVPLIIAGLLVACAGRELHHFVIKATGFLVGFLAVLAGFGIPVMANAWTDGDLGGLLGSIIAGLGIPFGVGLITLSLAWSIYVLTVTLPGFVGGGFVGLALIGSPESIIHFAFLFVLGFIGATIVWVIHELLLVVWTAFLGAVMVSLGLTGARFTGLPVLRRPELVLRNPEAAIVDTLAALDLFLPAIVVVFLLGLVVQWGLLPARSAEG